MAEAYFKSIWPQNERGPFGQDPLKGYAWEGAVADLFADGRGWDERSAEPNSRTRVYRVTGTAEQLSAVQAKMGAPIGLGAARRFKPANTGAFVRRLIAEVAGTPPNWGLLNDLLAKVPLFWLCMSTDNVEGAGALLVLAKDRGLISQAKFDAIRAIAAEESVLL